MNNARTPRFRLYRMALWTILALAVSTPALAQSQPRITGTIHHYTADVDGNGPWHIVGDWSLTLNTSNGTVDLLAALSMARSDNPTRSPHTHHVRMTGGQVSVIAGGFRISGTAAITTNGSAAGFSGSPIAIDVTGGNAIVFANIAIAFGGGAASHFGTDPVRGVVDFVQ